jgi:hypothetical protein
VETLASLLRIAGLLLVVAGLWFAAGGMRVVVSGRIDERRKAAGALRRGLPLVVAGIVMLLLGTWIHHFVEQP